MNQLGFRAARVSTPAALRIATALLVTALIALACLAVAPTRANAAFTISDWGMTATNVKAGQHPNLSFHLDPDAVKGDQNGDDLKTVKVEFAAGMLANPQAVSSPCTSSQFNGDSCPTGSKLASVTVKYRRAGSNLSMTGNMYLLPADANSVATFGIIMRPSGYQKVFLKSSKVGGIATVRTGPDADYGIDVTFDNIPRTLTTTLLGTQTAITINDITVNLQARPGTNASPYPYFTFNPTRCGTASARATSTSYLGATDTRSSSYTLTDCASVPFTPTFSAQFDTLVRGATTGVKATITVPTADATTQQSHVRTVTTKLPDGTGLNFPGISAVGALCTDAQLAADACPAASKIGTSAVNVPFLPSALNPTTDPDPAMNGSIYLMTRGSGITFGYTFHGAGNTLVTLKGSATVEDTNNDGIFESVVARLINLPQAPFSGATLDFDAALITNPTCEYPAAANVTANIAGWSGAAVSRVQSLTLPACDQLPDTTITGSPASPTNDSTPTFSFTSNVPTATFQCSVDGNALAACTSPYTTPVLSDGSHTFRVQAAGAMGVDPTPAVVTFVVDTTPPLVTITSPANGSFVGPNITLAFSVSDASPITSTTCRLDAAAATACTSPTTYSIVGVGSHTIVVQATDAAGNTGSAATTFTGPEPPRPIITAPANNSFLNSTSVTVAFSVFGTGTTTTCKLDAAAATACVSPQTYTGLAQGAHTVIVTATNATGSGSATVNFTVDTVAPQVQITSPANGSTTGSSITPVFTATDFSTTVVQTTCQLDAAAQTTCPSAYSGLTPGSHTLIVRATDMAGNVGTATTTWNVTGIPVVNITAPAQGAVLPTNSVSVEFNTAWPATSMTCKLDANPVEACTSPKVYSGLSSGLHTVVVTASNAAGSGSATVTFTAPGGGGSPPVVNIVSPAEGAALSGSSISITFTATNSPTSVTCKIDNGAATACTSPIALSGLSEGPHCITITATNASGSSSVTRCFVIDRSAPVVTITTPAQGSVIYSPSTVNAAFLATDAITSVTGTTCRIDAAAATACTSPVAYTGLAIGAHTITVSATDRAGNVGTASVSFNYSIHGDPSISSPANGSIVNTTSVSLVFSSPAPGGSTTCKLDAGAPVTCVSPLQYTGLTQGAHTLTVAYTDTSGNVGTATTNFLVDSIPPTVSITAPVNGALVPSNMSVAFTATDGTTSVAGTTCKLDAAPAAACTSPKSYTGLAVGSHTVTVSATDQAGNVGSSNVSFSVGDAMPSAIIIDPPTDGQQYQLGQPISISFTTTGSPTVVTCKLDAGAAVACTSPWVLTGVPLGSHCVTLTATNALGSGTTTRCFTVVSGPAPTVSFTTVPGPSTSTATPSFSFTLSSGATATCSIDGGAYVACTSPFTPAALSDQAVHCLSVIASNGGQNSAPATTCTYVDTRNFGTQGSASTAANSLTSAADANGPAKHPDLTVASAFQGATNPTSAALTLPKGLVVSPVVNGAIGTAGATFAATSSSSLLTVSGTLSKTSAPGTGDIGGVTFTATLPGGLGTVTVNGALRMINNSTNEQIVFSSLPTASSSGAPIHITALSLTLKGDAGAPSNPLVTTPSFCGTPNGTGNWAVNSSGTNPNGYIGNFGTVVTTASSVLSDQGSSTTALPTTGCSLTDAALTPAISGALASPTAGSRSPLDLTVSTATGDGSIQRAAVLLPPKLGPNLPAYGTVSDMCPLTSEVGGPTRGAGAASFDRTPCPAQSRIGQIRLTSAALGGDLIGDVYVINRVPLPDFGIYVAPAVSPANPQGVTMSFVISQSLPYVNATCFSSIDGCVSGSGPGSGFCDLDTQPCQQQIRLNAAILPDLPITSYKLSIGRNADGSTLSGRVGTGAITSNDFFQIADQGSTVCGLDLISGQPFQQSLKADLTGWSQTTTTGTALSGGVKSATGSLPTSGCNGTSAPLITVTSRPPSFTSSTSANVAFTVAGSPTSVTCRLDAGSAQPCTSPVAYTGLPDGSHTITVTATNADGSDVSAVSFTVDTIAPTLTITSPANGSVQQQTVTVTAPATDATAVTKTCKLDAGAVANCPATYAGLAEGAHTLVVTATDQAGNTTAVTSTFTVALPPTLTINSPINGQVYSGDIQPVLTFTVTPAGATVTCQIDSGAPFACGGGTALPMSSHTVTVCATSVGGTTCKSVSYTVVPPPPSFAIIDAPGPATNDTTPTVQFSGGGSGTTYTCSVDGGAASACTSPFTTADLGSATAIHSITVTATNAGGSQSKTTYTQVDTRTYGVTSSITKQANSLTPLANVNLPGAHPNVQVDTALAGAADTKKLVVVLPHGLSGSLASIPAAQRCSTAQAAAGTCPASSIVGTGTGQVVTTDSGTPVAVTGTGYLMDAPTSSDAAGLALKATVAGGRGDVIATGGVQLINNGSSQQMVADNIPTTTSLGVPFHATNLTFTLNGDTDRSSGVQAANGHPLITNQSYCFNPTATTGPFGPYNASTNPLGYKGQFVNVNATLTSYQGGTATANPAYTVSGCSATVPAYNPTLDITLDTPVPGQLTKATAVMTLPNGSSTTQRIASKLPPKFGPNLPSFGAATDMCPGTAATTGSGSTVGVGNTPFNRSGCPAQSRYGQIVITSPLLTDPVVGDVYLINKIPIPWLGIHVDPTISPTNPQGVTADLLLSSGLPYVNQTCSSSSDGCPAGSGPGTGICDLDFETCQQQISIGAAAIPDIPITRTEIYLGKNADGSDIAGRVGVGGITSNFPLQIAPVGDNTCSTGENPDAVTPGSPYTQIAVTQLTPWSTTTATGTGTFKTVNTTIPTGLC